MFQSYLYGIEIQEQQTAGTGSERFNRTFMELKSPDSIEAPGTAQSFNRTFMELKYCFECSKTHTQAFQSYLYGIEMKSSSTKWTPANCFNRTFMELKYFKTVL